MWPDSTQYNGSVPIWNQQEVCEALKSILQYLRIGIYDA